MIRELTDLLIHPADFFARKNAEPPNFFVPLVIVGAESLFYILLYALAAAFSPGYYYCHFILDRMGPGFPLYRMVRDWPGTVRALQGVFG